MWIHHDQLSSMQPPHPGFFTFRRKSRVEKRLPSSVNNAVASLAKDERDLSPRAKKSQKLMIDASRAVSYRESLLVQVRALHLLSVHLQSPAFIRSTRSCCTGHGRRTTRSERRGEGVARSLETRPTGRQRPLGSSQTSHLNCANQDLHAWKR